MIKSFAMKATFVALFLLAVVCSFLFYKNQQLNKENAKLEQSLASATIANTLLDGNLKINQEVVSKVIDEKNKLEDEKNVKIKEVRYALKNADCAVKPIPDNVSNSLLEYATDLRTRSMYTDSSRTDSTVKYPTTLTYEQAILWILPLLNTIAQCNSDRKAIRDIEKQRELLNN